MHHVRPGEFGLTPAESFEKILEDPRLYAILVTILVLAFLVFSRSPPLSLPGKLKQRGRVQLDAEHVFGDAGAAGRLRDLAHVIEQGEVVLLGPDPSAPRWLPPPPKTDGKLHSRARDGQEAELKSYLARALAEDGFAPPPGCEKSQAALGRLYDMLSFVPAGSVLRGADASPNLRHHRFVVLFGKSVLRTIATGYIGSDASLWLTVVSPNLLVCGGCAKSSCHVEYTVAPRGQGPSTIEDEIKRAAGKWKGRWRE